MRKVRKGWITNGIKISCKNERRHYLLVIERKVAGDYYKQYSNTLKSVIKKAKQLENKALIEQSENKKRQHGH